MENKIRFSLYYKDVLGEKTVNAIMGKALEISAISEEVPHQIAQFMHPQLATKLGLKDNEIAIIVINASSAKCVQTKHEKERELGVNGTAKYYGFVFDVNDFKQVDKPKVEPILPAKVEVKPKVAPIVQPKEEPKAEEKPKEEPKK